MERFVTEQLVPNVFGLLSMELRHLAKIESMPFLHRDPFDRLLIAQALSQKLIIVTADGVFGDYGIELLW